jgi:hypothetical protein
MDDLVAAAGLGQLPACSVDIEGVHDRTLALPLAVTDQRCRVLVSLR